MDHEIELNYRLTGHLEPRETVLATLISLKRGIYAATDRRVLYLNNEEIGYRLSVHPYECLDGVDCVCEEGDWFIQFAAGERILTVPARSEREARRFTEAVSRIHVASRETAVEQTA